MQRLGRVCPGGTRGKRRGSGRPVLFCLRNRTETGLAGREAAWGEGVGEVQRSGGGHFGSFRAGPHTPWLGLSVSLLARRENIQEEGK